MEETESTELDRWRLDSGSSPLGPSSSSSSRLRALSASFFASSSSATPFLNVELARAHNKRKGKGAHETWETYFRVASSGVSLVSLGTSLGLSSCWVRDGLGL